MRVARTVNLTREQVRAQLRLFTAIATAQQDGLAVPLSLIHISEPTRPY